MKIKFMYNDSSDNVIGKNLTQKFELEGTLKNDCSIVDPVIIVEKSLDHFIGVNYASISAFGRKYFVTDVVCKGLNIVEVSMHVDVLESFKNELLECEGIIKAQENKYNLYLDDGTFRAYQNPKITAKKFPSGFSGSHFVLAIAGS